jgi:hypothetical protein
VAVLDRFDVLEEMEADGCGLCIGRRFGIFWECCGFFVGEFGLGDGVLFPPVDFVYKAFGRACVRWDGGLLLPRRRFFTLLHI